MARQFDFEVKKQEIHKTLVTNINFDPQRFNARYKMPTDEEIKILAEDIKNSPEGQKNPIAIWFVNENGKKVPYVVEGFCRWLALKQIYDEEFDSGAKEFTLTKFRVVPDKTSLKQILCSNIAENEKRFELTIVDKAYGMKLLKEREGMSQAEIAEVYHCTQATVSNYLKLMTLPSDVLDKIHSGKLNYSDAMLLVKHTPDKASEIIKNVEKEVKAMQSDTKDTKISNPRVPGDTSVSDKKRIKEAIKKENGTVKFKNSIKDYMEGISMCEEEYFNMVDEGKKPPIDPDMFRLVFNPIAMYFDGTYNFKEMTEKVAKNISLKKEKN